MVAILAVVNAFNLMDRMALAVLAPMIQTDLQVSDTQLGLLTGLAFALFYAVCGVPIARWADSGVRRNIIALAVATWSVMTALSGAAQTFWQLLLARVGVGAGEAGSHSPGSSILCDYVPLKSRPGVFAIHAFGLTVGVMLGMTLAGWLGEALGWRWTFVALGLPGIALALLVRFTVREPRRGYYDNVQHEDSDSSLARTLAILWKCHTYRLLVLYLVANGFVQTALIQWWPSFYVRSLGLDLSFAGIHLGFALGIGMGVGVLIGGAWANKLGKHAVGLPLKLGFAAILVALPAALASLFLPSAVASMLLVGITGLCWEIPIGPLMAALFSVTAPKRRAMAGAVSTFVTSAVGFSLGPFCVGALSDQLRGSLGSESLRYALLVPVFVLPVMAFALRAAARTLPSDLRLAVDQGPSNAAALAPITGAA